MFLIHYVINELIFLKRFIITIVGTRKIYVIEVFFKLNNLDYFYGT